MMRIQIVPTLADCGREVGIRSAVKHLRQARGERIDHSGFAVGALTHKVRTLFQ